MKEPAKLFLSYIRVELELRKSGSDFTVRHSYDNTKWYLNSLFEGEYNFYLLWIKI